MEDIKDVCLGPMPTSDFLNPVRMTFTQNGKKRYWDFVKNHQSVSCLIFNTSRKVLMFVKQFRPAVYANNAMKKSPNNTLEKVDWTKTPASLGVTIELCAGIVDANIPYNEIMKKEVLEECGYDVPVGNFQKLVTYQAGIGSSGDQGTIFFAECTDAMKVTEGGGLADEGELIQVVEMTIPEIREYIARDSVASPGGFLFAVMWFLVNKAPSY